MTPVAKDPMDPRKELQVAADCVQRLRMFEGFPEHGAVVIQVQYGVARQLRYEFIRADARKIADSANMNQAAQVPTSSPI
jgi:hypothetical protein